jgi:hypothetical protein
MRSLCLGLLAATLFLFSGGGCSCGPDPQQNLDGGTLDGGGTPGDGGGTPDGGGTDAGTGDGGTQCVALGGACAASGLTCCQGSCGGNGTCEAQETQCSGIGQSCNSAGDCCSGASCGTSNTCQTCVQVGAPCANNAQCCTLTCGANGQCQELTATPSLPGGSSATCINGGTNSKVSGQTCASSTECCSNNCQGGVCKAAYFCQATGDICTANDDCCSGRCSSTNGAAGRCFESTGGRSIDGDPCNSGGECATRVCVDLGFGAKVCSPASGCSVTGNACATNAECCGGAPDPLGDVRCVDFKCNGGQACNEVGVVCALGSISDAPGGNTCCDTMGADRKPDNGGESCRFDSSGIPRCFGGVSDQCPSGYTGTEPCCIAQGQDCRFSDQCCGGALCLQNPDGGPNLTCQGVTCKAAGATCDPNAAGQCCSGFACQPAGEFGYACQLPTDAGTSAPVCRPDGTACSAGADCCSGVCPVPTDGGARVCTPTAPCQGTGGACTSGADCCSGFQCGSNPDGGSQNVCQTGGCSSGGQSCSSNGQCCNGLSCVDPTGGACTGTTACTCSVIIG